MEYKKIQELSNQYEQIEKMLPYLDNNEVTSINISFNDDPFDDIGTDYIFVFDEFEKILKQALEKLKKEINEISRGE